MRLHVCVFGSEEQLRPVACEVLGDVDELASPVVSLPRVPFRVFVCQGAPYRLQNGHADEILRSDKLELGVLTLYLAVYRGVYFRVRLPDVCHCSHHSSSVWTNQGRTSLICSATVSRKILSLTRLPAVVPRPPYVA